MLADKISAAASPLAAKNYGSYDESAGRLGH